MKFKVIGLQFLLLLLTVSWNFHGSKGETMMFFPAELVSRADAVTRSGKASFGKNQTEIGVLLALLGRNIMWLFCLSLFIWSLFLEMLPNGFAISIGLWFPFLLQTGQTMLAECFWYTLAFLKDMRWRGLWAFSMVVSTLLPKCFVQDKYGCFLACNKLKSAGTCLTTAIGVGAFYSTEQLPGGGCMHSVETRQEQNKENIRKEEYDIKADDVVMGCVKENIDSHQVDLFLYLWMWLRSLKRVVQRGILCVMKKPLPSLPPKVCLQEGFRCCFAYGNIRRTRPRSTDLNGGMRCHQDLSLN